LFVCDIKQLPYRYYISIYLACSLKSIFWIFMIKITFNLRLTNRKLN